MKRLRHIAMRLSLLPAFIMLIGCESQQQDLPEEFFGLSLQKKMTGEEAKNFVNKLHTGEVTREKNEIGFYRGENGEATIYITYYNNSEAAAREGKKMTEKISPENSVFIMGENMEVNGKPVYRCFGMGQTHYVFSHQNRLFWLSVNTLIAQRFLEQYLAYLQ